MKKLIIPILLLLMFSLIGCGVVVSREEYFNDKDKTDFVIGSSVKFDIIQLKNVMDERTLKESNLNGSYFLFMGSISAESTEKTVLNNMYYGYLRNQNGGIYFAQIPASKVRIYEDSEVPVIVAYNRQDYELSANTESIWDQYEMFNLHVPKGTIIPRVDLSFDLINK